MNGGRLVPYHCKKCDKVVIRALPDACVMCPVCLQWVRVEKGKKEVKKL